MTAVLKAQGVVRWTRVRGKNVDVRKTDAYQVVTFRWTCMQEDGVMEAVCRRRLVHGRA